MGILPIIGNMIVHFSVINALQFLIQSLIIPDITKVDMMVDFLIAIISIGIPTGSLMILTIIISTSISIMAPILPIFPLI